MIENPISGELKEADNVITEPVDYTFDPEKSNLVYHAKTELDAIGMTEDSEDEMNRMMRKHLLHMVVEFAKEGHSGFSAGYAINALTKLFDFKPLSPLSGKDEEWTEVSDKLWQNKRCCSVFKDEDGRAYDINGRVFWEWYDDPDTGEKYKSYFTGFYSRTEVQFPYVVPNEPIYVEWTETWEDIRDNKVDWWKV